MGFIFDLPDMFLQPGHLEELKLYLNDLQIEQKKKKQILFEYRDLTGEEITREDILDVYSEEI